MMANMGKILFVTLLMAVGCYAGSSWGWRNIEKPWRYIYEKMGKKPSTEFSFPEKRSQVKHYQGLFPENPTAQDLYANVDMDTEYVQFMRNYQEETFGPPYINEVVPGKVYQAIGFALGYPVIYVTPEDTLIWIDAPESGPSALECIAAFRAIPAIGTKPIVALIYTIFHADHIWGAVPIVEDPNNVGRPAIIAHERLLAEAQRYDTFKGFKSPRLYRMFAAFVPDPPHVNDGGVERVRLEGPYQLLELPSDYLYFETQDAVLSRTIGGLKLEFISVPGYTSDQVIVWAPEWQVMHGADVFYDAFPNLYTLRGEPGRDVLKWGEGTRTAASYDSEYFVTTHGLPKAGQELIKEVLTDYADAIQYIHDQTVRYMSKGFPPDIIPRVVNLPENLKSKPYLKEMYGIEDTAIKGVFDFYVGWFSGLTEELFQVDRFERGERLIDLIGKTSMQIEAGNAYNEGRYEWALEMSTYLWRDDPSDTLALDIRTECLKRLGEQAFSITGRNYVISTVMEDWDLVNNVVDTATSFILLHLDGAMKNLQFHVNNSAVYGVSQRMDVVFPDKGLTYELEIRNSVLDYEIVPAADPNILTLTVNDECVGGAVVCWRNMLAGFVPFTVGQITNGGPEDILHFFSYFDFSDEIDGGYTPHQSQRK